MNLICGGSLGAFGHFVAAKLALNAAEIVIKVCVCVCANECCWMVPGPETVHCTVN